MFSKPAKELMSFKSYKIIPNSNAPKNCSRLVRETFELLEQIVCLIKEKYGLFDDSTTEYVEAEFSDSTYTTVRILLINSSEYKISDIDTQNIKPIEFLKSYYSELHKECHPYRMGWSHLVITLDPSNLPKIKDALEKLPKTKAHIELDEQPISIRV